MPGLTTKDFVSKWGQVQLKETAASQSHFNDIFKRAQLCAHYTSEADIMLIVEPVLMTTLRQKWIELRQQFAGRGTMADTAAKRTHTHELLADFAAEIAAVCAENKNVEIDTI